VAGRTGPAEEIPGLKKTTDMRITRTFFALLGLSALPAAADAAPPKLPLDYFAGQWACSGHFTNGRPIAATIAARWDEAAGTLIVRHDDVAGGGYHAVETWGASVPSGTLRASIVIAGTGIRWFASPGWASDTLTWALAEPGDGVDRFVYTRRGLDAMTVDWAVSEKGGEFQIGDALECTRR
jgi:hypothetical protein